MPEPGLGRGAPANGSNQTPCPTRPGVQRSSLPARRSASQPCAVAVQ
ncbi:hypothetical protein HMPREF1550_01803 [Actinomyces sp. oral taxon 877 str. F0543]|nr:hypothetical protein HMPREF1550_01803 [Actinomyces sp. oral taxon 877 str. F0543]